jgi:hypothetical protein
VSSQTNHQIVEQPNSNVFQSYSYNLDNNKNENTNELVLNDTHTHTKTDASNNSTVEDTLFTANTYGENDVDMVQDIINDIIQKEDLKKDEISETNKARDDLEEARQNKKETELFLEETMLDEDVTGVELDTNINSNQSMGNVENTTSYNNTGINQTLEASTIEVNFGSNKNESFRDLDETPVNSSSKNSNNVDALENSSFASTNIDVSQKTDTGKKISFNKKLLPLNHIKLSIEKAI